MADTKEVATTQGSLNRTSELMPVSIRDKMTMAEYLAKSNLMPSGLKSPAQIFVALQMGHELGLAPMMAVRNISVINGMPTLSADLLAGLIRQHPGFVSMRFTPDEDVRKTKSCTTTIVRKEQTGEMSTFTGTFTYEDAKNAGLLNKDVWKKYWPRMLKHRALAYCARDSFPDVLAGVYLKEEATSIRKQPRDVTPEEVPEEAKGPKSVDELLALLPDAEKELLEAALPDVVDFIASAEDCLTDKEREFLEAIQSHALQIWYDKDKSPASFVEAALAKARKTCQERRDPPAPEKEEPVISDDEKTEAEDVETEEVGEDEISPTDEEIEDSQPDLEDIY
jgi:hypothetical protein